MQIKNSRRTDWQAHLRRSGQPSRAAYQSAKHPKHKNAGFRLEVLDGNDLGADGIGDSGAYEHTSSELANGCDEHGLHQGERSRGDGCGKAARW